MRNVMCFFTIVLLSSSTLAADIPVRARVFLGSSEGNLSNVNTEIKNLGLEGIGSVPLLGAEITYSVLPIVEVGLNYFKRQNVRKSTANNSYGTEFDQDVFLGILRLTLLKTEFVRADVFAGVGGANTTLKIISATQSGTLENKNSAEWVATSTSRYGASIGAGMKGIYLYFEGGYESNKVGSLNRTGSLSSNIDSIDMSGPYGMIGLQFDAPEITKM